MKVGWCHNSHILLSHIFISIRLQKILEVTQANMQYRLLSVTPSELCLELLPRSAQQSLKPLQLSITTTTNDHFHLQVRKDAQEFKHVRSNDLTLVWNNHCVIWSHSWLKCVTQPASGVPGHRWTFRGVDRRTITGAERCSAGGDAALHQSRGYARWDTGSPFQVQELFLDKTVIIKFIEINQLVVLGLHNWKHGPAHYCCLNLSLRLMK